MKATNDFKKDFYKLMNNSVFWENYEKNKKKDRCEIMLQL